MGLRTSLAPRTPVETTPATETPPPLSPRQRQVLTLVAEGATNRGIAGRLGVTKDVVDNYLAAAMRRLGARNRTHAVVLAWRRGEIELEEGA